MTTVHLVYPHGSRTSCPDSIGRNLGAKLAECYRVIHYDWYEFSKIKPAQGDVLLGHACPLPFTVFRRSCRDKRWKRVILLSPHCHGDDFQPAFNDRIINDCDLYLAITGRYWFDHVGTSGFRHWLPKMRHVDLAVDPADFPKVKTTFNAPGQRKFVYVGSNAWYKNLRYLKAIADILPAGTINWIGSDSNLGRVQALGRRDFSQAEGRALIAQHDFLITVGNADGNPTTILEAMAWGLIPVCTLQSGYPARTGLINVPLANPNAAALILADLQQTSLETLSTWQLSNWEAVETHYTWDRFAKQVRDAIESEESPPIGKPDLPRMLQIRWAEIRSPFWADLVSPRKLIRRGRKLINRSHQQKRRMKTGNP